MGGRQREKEGEMMMRAEQYITEEQRRQLDELIDDVYDTPETRQRYEEWFKERFGVEALGQLAASDYETAIKQLESMTESWIGMLRELYDESDRMTAWEVEFVESLNKQHERSYAQRQYWTPTDKQFETLEKIWYRVFG